MSNKNIESVPVETEEIKTKIVDIYPSHNDIVTSTLSINGIIFNAELPIADIITCLQKRAKVYEVFPDGTREQLFLYNLKDDLYKKEQAERKEAAKLKEEYAIFKSKEQAYIEMIAQLETDQ